MPSPPTLFDDEGDDHDPDGNRAATSGPQEDRGDAAPRRSNGFGTGGRDIEPGAERDDDRTARPNDMARRRGRRSEAARHPNYLFRRAVAVGGIVAVFVAAGVVVANLIGTGADTSIDGSASIEWNRVVTVDDRLGVLVVTDDEGEQQARRDAGIRGITGVGVVGATAVFDADGEVTVIDLAASEDSADPEPVVVEASGITRPSGSALTMLTPATSAGRGLIVHGPSGDRLDTDAFAPVAGARYEFGTARSDPSGRHVLVTDSGNFQSVLFSFDRDEPSYFPGLALAVDSGSVVTAQNVGNDATVSVFDHTGELLGSARTPSVRAALLAGDTVYLVTVDGRIVDLDIGSGDTSEGDQLGIGTVTEGHVGTTGDRVIVVGTDGTAIVADDGAVLGSFDGLQPRDTATPSAPLGTRCLSLGEGSNDRLVMVDTTTGDVVAEARAAGIVHPSADGCTVIASTVDGVDVVAADSVRRVDVDGTLVAVSPDATRIVVERDARLVLTPLPNDTGTATDAAQDDGEETIVDGGVDDGVDIGPRGRLVAFTEL